jgi:uncharacterized protein (DUF1330 family)
MSAYLIVDIEITDPATYAEYIERVPAVVYQYGGRYVSRGNDVVPLAGGWVPDRVIILEFADMAQLARFGRSAEYQSLAPLRERSTRTRSIAVPGVDSQPA